MLMFSVDIADAFGRHRIARFDLFKNHVFFWMMATIRIILKISDDSLYNFIIWAFLTVENTELVL